MNATLTASRFRIGEITDPASFEALAPQWNQLLERLETINPFWTFEWQSSWWKTLGAGRELLTLTLRDESGTLLALAPMMISRRHGVRVLEFIGSGLSDYPGFIGVSVADGSLAAILKCLAAHRRRWDVMDLRLCEDGIAPADIRAAAECHGLSVDQRMYEVAPYLPITCGWEDFVKAKSKKFRYAVREREKRFLAQPGASVRRLDPAQIDGSLAEALWEVERQSWKVKVGTAPMLRPEVRAFYREFLGRLARRGWVEAWLASMNETPVAYVLNFVLGDRVLLYAVSFRADFAHLAPGMLLLQSSIRAAFERKAREYDFLCGREDYKDRWAAGRRQVLQLVVSKAGVRSRLAAVIAYRFRWALARSPRLRALKVRLAGAAARARVAGNDTP